MKKLSRRANSLPARPEELGTGSLNELDLLQPDVEAKVATSPSLVDPRSPPAVATCSPVFDLELGGSLTSTPHDRHAQGRSQRTVRRRCAAGPPIALRPLDAATPVASALQKLPGALAQNAGAANNGPGVGGAGLDRSASDLQVMLGRGAHHAALHSAERRTAAGERIVELCTPATELELELSQYLRAFRAARIAKKPPFASSGPTSASSVDRPASDSATAAAAAALQVPGADGAGVSGGGGPSGPTPGEIEALASELQSAGFIVQILDGTRLSKDVRSCLRTLKHQFLVCLGTAAARRGSLQGHERRLGAPRSTPPAVAAAAAASGSDQGETQQAFHKQQQQKREQILSEPLVVEVRFREQFLIANPTTDYELLLLTLPVAFVGPLRRLDEVVSVMAAEIAAVFRGAKRPLPPWRTKSAMLSKWAPEQLGELQRMMESMALRSDPSEVDCDDSWGSGVFDPSNPLPPIIAPPGPQDPLTKSLQPAPPRVVFSGPWPWTQRSAADAEVDSAATAADGGGASAAPSAAAAAAAAAGVDVMDDPSEVVPRSISAPPRAMTSTRSSVVAATSGGDGDTADGALTQSDGGLPVINMDSLDELMRERLSSLSQIEPAAGGAAVVVAGRSGALSGPGGAAASADVAAAKSDDLTRWSRGEEAGLRACGRDGGAGRAAVELSFPILPEVLPTVGAGVAGLKGSAHAPPGQQPMSGDSEAALPPPLLSPAAAEETAEFAQADGVVRAGPTALPSLRHMAGLSAFSPFACISVPEQHESEYDDRDSCDRRRRAPWSAQLPTFGGGGAAAASAGAAAGGGSSDGSFSNIMPEFTFKHTALDFHHPGYSGYEGGDLDQGHRDAPGWNGGGGGGARLDLARALPTPPRATPLAAIRESASPGAAGPAAPPPGGGRAVLADSSPVAAATAVAAAPAAALNLAHQPLACGALGLAGVAAAVPDASAAPPPSRGLAPSVSHPPTRNGGDGTYQFPKPDALSFTRRSSSDLHRAAEKFKKATSLLASALRMAVGGGGGGSAATAATAAAAAATAGQADGSGQQPQQKPQTLQRQQQQRGGVAKDVVSGAPSAATPAAAAVASPARSDAASGVAPAANGPAVGGAGAGAAGAVPARRAGGGMQVALAGGVMTQPAADEPAWARIRTLKWSQPGAGTAVAAAAGPAPSAGPGNNMGS